MAIMKALVVSAKLNQTRIKADRTATIGSSTLVEINEGTFNFLNELYFSGDPVKLVVVSETDYNNFIVNEANRIAQEIEEE